MKKRVPTIVGIFALILLLAGAAYVGGRLYRTQKQATAGRGHELGKQVTPAPEVPLAPPDGRGEVQSRDGNSIIICDPESQAQPSVVDKNGTIQEVETCSPQFEVVIMHDTVLLHDVTGRTDMTPLPNGDLVLQEVVQPGSDVDLSSGTVIRVWGTLTGNRIVAQTVLYWNHTPLPTPVSGSK
jgi:hypothetical protein